MTSFQKSILIVAIVIFASGVTPIAIRITQAQGIPSLIIVFIRLWIVSISLFPIVWSRYRKNLLALSPAQIALSAIAGFWFALNLLMLFLALEYTSVLITSIMRRTTPLWIILPEIVLLGAVFTRRTGLSIILSISGVMLIAPGGTGAIETGSQPLIGAGMAGFGALCFGIYLLIGRKLSKDVPAILYSWLVFLFSAFVISLFTVFSGTPITGYSVSAYIWVLIVTVLAQFLGQIAINMGLSHFSATAMAIILQVGVVVSAIIATFLFSEIPTLAQGIGSVMVIAGVILVTMERNQNSATPTKTSNPVPPNSQSDV